MADSETFTTVESICDMKGPRRTTAITRSAAGSSFVARFSAAAPAIVTARRVPLRRRAGVALFQACSVSRNNPASAP